MKYKVGDQFRLIVKGYFNIEYHKYNQIYTIVNVLPGRGYHTTDDMRPTGDTDHIMLESTLDKYFLHVNGIKKIKQIPLP